MNPTLFFPDWIQLILPIRVLRALIFLADQVMLQMVPCGSFSVLFRWCSTSVSTCDQHHCSKPETQLDLPQLPSPFLFGILSISTNQSQSIQVSFVSRSLPRHSSQPVTPFSCLRSYQSHLSISTFFLRTIAIPCQSSLSYTHAGTVSLIWPQKLELIVLLNAFCKPS